MQFMLTWHEILRSLALFILSQITPESYLSHLNIYISSTLIPRK